MSERRPDRSDPDAQEEEPLPPAPVGPVGLHAGRRAGTGSGYPTPPSSSPRRCGARRAKERTDTQSVGHHVSPLTARVVEGWGHRGATRSDIQPASVKRSREGERSWASRRVRRPGSRPLSYNARDALRRCRRVAGLPSGQVKAGHLPVAPSLAACRFAGWADAVGVGPPKRAALRPLSLPHGRRKRRPHGRFPRWVHLAGG